MFLLSGLIFIASLYSQCGPSVDPATTQAIIQVESGGDPFAIGDNTLKKSFSPRTKTEAIALASYLLANGHSIDMGLMQVNSCHIKTMRLSLDELFDPCNNISIGTSILADFYKRYDNEADKNIVLFKALSAYNTGSAWKGPGYINRILKAANAPYRVAVLHKNSAGSGGINSAGKRQAARHIASAITAATSPLFFNCSKGELTAGEGLTSP
jgi:type IV secretion system protein VirB1